MVRVRSDDVLAVDESCDEPIEARMTERHVRCAEGRDDLDAVAFQVGAVEHDSLAGSNPQILVEVA
jgi:hypothetical protein